MLTLKDCADFCDLSDDEILGLLGGAGMSPIDVCATVQQFADTPSECRKMVGFLQSYLEKVESKEDTERAHEVHEAIDHFVSNHAMI